jgi:hypothetical protein
MQKKNKIWFGAGVLVEIIHFIIFFVFIIFGKLWLPGILVYFIITITVFGQLFFSFCPMTRVSDYCFKRYNPKMKILPSSTVYLYGKFGPWVSIPILIILVSISILVGVIF